MAGEDSPTAAVLTAVFCRNLRLFMLVEVFMVVVLLMILYQMIVSVS